MAGRILSIKFVKRFKHLIIFFTVVLFGLFIFFPNYAKLRKLRGENARLNRENKILEEEITDYQEKLLRVGNDPYLYEKIARDELGIAKDNEIVIDIKR